MISRPTTAQVLDDCARELRDEVLPTVRDPALRVRLEMMELMLRSCGVRAAHEIAWMQEEAAEMEAFATHIADGQPPSGGIRALLEVVTRERSDSLHLDDQVRNYDRAGQAFSSVLGAVLDGSDPAAKARTRQLLVARCEHEREMRPGFYFPGRT